MSIDTTEETKEPRIPTPKETRLDVTRALMSKKQVMTNEYKALVNHTGGMLSTSMSIAYSKGIEDAINLIFKLNEGDTNV